MIEPMLHRAAVGHPCSVIRAVQGCRRQCHAHPGQVGRRDGKAGSRRLSVVYRTCRLLNSHTLGGVMSTAHLA